MPSRLVRLSVLATPLLAAVPAGAEFQGIDVRAEFVDIPGFGAAKVIRLYAVFDNPADQLHLVYGTTGLPMSFTLTTHGGDGGPTPFYAHPGGGDSAPLTAFFPFFCNLRYDSYIDIGRVCRNVGDNNLDFAPLFPPPDWEATGSLDTTNGSWQRLPNDPLTFAGGDGRVFFGQFTRPFDGTYGPEFLSGVCNFWTIEDGVLTIRTGVTFDELPKQILFLDDQDFNGDQRVNVDDLVTVIERWGDCEPCSGGCDECYCHGDANGDGTVNVADLMEVIVAWGSM